MNAIKLGKFLTKIRKEKGITQQELADMLHEDKRKISRWECGNSFPEFDVLIKLGKIFDVTLYEFAVGERIKDKTILELAKDRLKGIKSFRLLKWSKKLLIILAILFGIFLGLSAIYTVRNYNTVHVYKLESLNKDFRIVGNYIKTKNYESFNITYVGYLGESKMIKLLEIEQLEYDICISEKRIIDISGSKHFISNKKYNLINDVLGLVKYTNAIPNPTLMGNETLTLNIFYYNQNNIQEVISIPFILDEKFNNSFI